MVYHGKDVLRSKRCGSWRPEAVLLDMSLKKPKIAYCYVGMGGQEATGIEAPLVVFVRRMHVLLAILDVLQINTTIARHACLITI